ncbi:MAG: hypothetical protein ABI629_16610 [bacterium]
MEKPKPDTPRSRQLHDAGFTSMADALACTKAVGDDLEAGRIDASEANRINDAVGRWRRAHGRKGGR